MFHVPAVFKMRLQYLCLSVHLLMNIATKYLLYIYIYGDADKSLARPRRKQATATKLAPFFFWGGEGGGNPHSGISGPTLRRASACPNLHE